jgi:glycosyltransferase involved in cell wall biosynthesis
MRMLVINQYYTPDKAASGQLLSSLCEGLAGKGVQIDVICGIPSYTDDAPIALKSEQKSNLTIRRISTGGVKGRAEFKKRVLGYLGFFFFAYFEVLKCLKKQKYDIVLTLSNPPFVGLLGLLAKRKRGIQFVYVLHDVHPDILIRSGRLKKGILTSFWEFISASVMKNADKIVVLGSRMAEYLEKNKGVQGAKIKIIHNWPVDEIKLIPHKNNFRNMYNPGDSLLILYSGNMGISHNLEWLIESASNLINYNVLFVFVGEGEKKCALQSKARQMQLENVLFLPYQNENLYNEMLSASDICVVALKPELAGLSVPSKIYPIMAAGRPVLAVTSMDSDIAEIVQQWYCGWIAQSSEEVTAIVKNILQQPDELIQYGQSSRSAYEQAYSKQHAMKLYLNLIEEVNHLN